MSDKHEIRALLKTINSAIEQAENLELIFAAQILTMAQLELDQTDIAVADKHRDDRGS